MFNVIYSKSNKTFLLIDSVEVEIDCSVIDFLNKLCLIKGNTLQGSINASKYLMSNVKKLPIYLPLFDDFLIPLGTNDGNTMWFSSNNYLTCYEKDNKCHIRFKDRSEFLVNYSKYSVCSQYFKSLELRKKQEEIQEFINKNIKYNSEE